MLKTISDDLRTSLQLGRLQLVQHPVYANIKGLAELRVFMEHHIFAVWDFMSLLKALQRGLTCVEVPWVPRADGSLGRLINDIVLGEETDEVSEGIGDGHMSHFELYRAAMAQCGANTEPIDAFVELLKRGVPVRDAMARAGAPSAARGFVSSTFDMIEAGELHAIGASFTLGREDLIPDMFRALVADLDRRVPGCVSVLSDYLRRHIQLDEEHHTPMAMRMLEVLCDGDPRKEQEAAIAGREALKARLRLWDGILAACGTSSAVDVPLSWLTQGAGMEATR